MVRQRRIPLLAEEGNAPLINCCEATEATQTGWSDRHPPDLAELLLRLRASLEAARYRACASRGLALRATPAPASIKLSRHPSSARKGIRLRVFQIR